MSNKPATIPLGPSPSSTPATDPSPAVPVQDRLLWNLKTIENLTGIPERTLFKLRSSGRMPQPDIRCGRRCYWRPDTIREWISQGCR
jgi:predicted DNA-binding transcriptional regulator AlpA